jgi:hypothetical protein
MDGMTLILFDKSQQNTNSPMLGMPSVVREVIVGHGSAVKVRLTDMTEHRADVVVFAADGHAMIYRMLGRRFTDPLIESFYNDWTERDF